ncbi:leukotriene A-4 hydrolase-like [Temnothorax curvispinosus]|uniref:Leukotriene A-4 hydrolase-like n=1 Tax=Temnothorax curvispinosus TaxID=300111 RepID=A0A6J1RJB6_9HYME|nr:leukotriene A-4 hydrolase-like [Temnothorax curvispinosus]
MDQPSQPPARDIPYSYSRPDLVAVIHTRLELSVNFDDRVLEGKAILEIEKKESTCNELVLDTYGLEIGDVTDYHTGVSLTKAIDNHDDKFGSKLIIELPNVDSSRPWIVADPKNPEEIYEIQIKYKTSPESPALYWIEPHQTSDGIPLLISNSKLTYARAIFPCQDTPSNRTSFHSKIYIPSGLNVMMPGARSMDKVGDQDVYTFLQFLRNIAPHEIYIIVGSLIVQEVASIGNLRCNLWTENIYLNEGTWAIHKSKIMTMLSNIKESYHFYNKDEEEVDEVNVCVLPPNVPEFDMQYPDVTFVSSTLLEGHYSLIDTIVQNIIESWIGRSVVIENFTHLWLIKGLSTFIYRNPINNIIDDGGIREFLKIKGINNVLNMPELHTDSLVPTDLTKLPMNIIKYVSEKGCAFLNYLQNMLGGSQVFTGFLVGGVLPLHRSIDNPFLTTDRFKILLNAFFSVNGKDQILNNIDWDKWFNEPDFPPSYHNPMIIRSRWQRWVEQETACFDTIKNFDQFNDFAIIEFLTYLLALPNTVLTVDKLQKIEDTFLRNQEICEIRFLWLRLCIKNRWLDDNRRIFEDAINFVSEYCMPKYACPIIRDLYNLEETRELAKIWFVNQLDNSKMLPETINELSNILGVTLDDRE